MSILDQVLNTNQVTSYQQPETINPTVFNQQPQLQQQPQSNIDNVKLNTLQSGFNLDNIQYRIMPKDMLLKTLQAQFTNPNDAATPNTDTLIQRAKQAGINITTSPDGKSYLVGQDNRSFMDKYQGAIATAGLGLQAFGAYTNYKNYLENKKTMGIQRDMMKEQLKETKEEYSRIKNLRAKLNAKY